MAPKLTNKSKARSRDAWGGAVGKGKFSTSEIPRERICVSDVARGVREAADEVERV